MTRRTGILLALLSWVILITPWQRCRSECQDILAVVGHSCHEESSPLCHARHEHPGAPCPDDCEAGLAEHDDLELGLGASEDRDDPSPAVPSTPVEESSPQPARPRAGVLPAPRREARPPPALAHLACVVLLR